MTSDAESKALATCQLTDSPWRYAFQVAEAPDAPLVIAAHGSDRDIRGLLDGVALEGQVSVLAPLFPAEIDGENTGDDYKFLTGGGADYLVLMDRILADALTRLTAQLQPEAAMGHTEPIPTIFKQQRRVVDPLKLSLALPFKPCTTTELFFCLPIENSSPPAFHWPSKASLEAYSFIPLYVRWYPLWLVHTASMRSRVSDSRKRKVSPFSAR